MFMFRSAMMSLSLSLSLLCRCLWGSLDDRRLQNRMIDLLSRRGDFEGVEHRAGRVEEADEQGQVDQGPLPVGPLPLRVERCVNAALGGPLLGESSSRLLAVSYLCRQPSGHPSL